MEQRLQPLWVFLFFFTSEDAFLCVSIVRVLFVCFVNVLLLATHDISLFLLR